MLEFGLVQRCPSRLSGEKGGVYIPALCPPIFLLLPNDFAPFPLSFFLTFLWFPFAIQSAIRSTNRHASLAFRLGHVLERAVPETQKWRRLGLVPLPIPGPRNSPNKVHASLLSGAARAGGPKHSIPIGPRPRAMIRLTGRDWPEAQNRFGH